MCGIYLLLIIDVTILFYLFLDFSFFLLVDWCVWGVGGF